MTTDNTSIIEKIRALRARTEAAGCTEDEAMQAAAMIARLMAKHALTDADITEAEATGIGVGRDKASQQTKHRDKALDFVVNAIAKLTETKIVISGTSNGRRTIESSFAIFGMDADREMANYLLEVVRSAATRGWNTHSAATGHTGDAKRKAFRIGVCHRISVRIMEIVNARDAERAAQPASTALVIRKADLINSIMPRTQPTTARAKRVDSAAFNAGQAYGNNVNLGRPVAGARTAAGAIA